MSAMRTPTVHTAADGTQTYKVRLRDAGKQTSRTFARVKDAEKFCQWIDQYGPATALDLLDSRRETTDELTVRQLCTRHVDNIVGVTAGTIADYRRYIDRDLGEIADLPASALDRETVKRWVKWMESRGQSGKTIKNKHNFISSVMKQAVIAGTVPTNPCVGVKLPRSIKADMTILSHDEYTRFLGCFEPRWLPIVEVLFGTGLRFGEVTALRPMDVNLDARTISITRSWKKNGKIGPPKSQRSRRTIAIVPQTIAAIAPVMEGRRRDDLIFVNDSGNRITSSLFHSRVWGPALDLANGKVPMRSHGGGRRPTIDRPGRTLTPLDPPLGRRPRVHDARHSCASWMLDADVPIHVVSAHLGHENITTTVDTYGHLLPSAQGYVRDALSAALSASRPQLVP